MNFTNKILLEASGVPMPILDVVKTITDKVMSEFPNSIIGNHKNTFKFKPTKEFPVKQINFRIEGVKEFTGIDNFDGGTNSQFQRDEEGYYTFEVFVSPNPGAYVKPEQIATELESTLTHEFTHVYENIKRKEKTGFGIDGSRDVITSIGSNDIMKNPHLPPSFRKFLYMMYSVASFEISARTAQLYPYIKNVTDVKERVKIIKDSQSWQVAEHLTDFSLNSFFRDFQHEVSLLCVFQNMTPPEFFVDLSKQLEQALLGLNSEHFDLNSKTLNLTDENFEKTQLILKKGFERTNHILHKDLKSFFEYWTKIFHRGGDKAKKKLLKLATI